MDSLNQMTRLREVALVLKAFGESLIHMAKMLFFFFTEKNCDAQMFYKCFGQRQIK